MFPLELLITDYIILLMSITHKFIRADEGHGRYTQCKVYLTEHNNSQFNLICFGETNKNPLTLRHKEEVENTKQNWHAKEQTWLLSYHFVETNLHFAMVKVVFM